MELVKDYDCTINYHPGKANVVADALSRKAMLSSVVVQPALLRDIQELKLEIVPRGQECRITAISAQPLLLDKIKEKQLVDKVLMRQLERVEANKETDFSIDGNGLMRYKGRLCVPNDLEVRREILAEAHSTPYSVHPGSTKMYRDLKLYYWWPSMKNHIAEFVARCLTCQRVKAEHQRPSGTLRPLEIPQWKWEHVTMDFVSGLPKSERGNDSIWVIVDRLTKTAHFLGVKTTYSVDRYAELYVKEIVRLHGIPVSIVSDRDPRFTSKFWKGFHKAMGTKLEFGTAFHPESDGQSERVIQILEDMLRACVIDWSGKWERYLPLVEFSYNNSYQATIGMAPYEALYGRKCRSPIHWDEVGEARYLEKQLATPEVMQETKEVVEKIRANIKMAQSRQKSYADRRRKELTFEVGGHVFLKVAPMKGVMRFGKKGKLSPRFIGPFQILDKVGDRAYRLALPPSLLGVHNVFHVSMLRKYLEDPSHVLSYESLELTPGMTYEEVPVRVLEREVKQLRKREIALVKILWRNQKFEEATWETEAEMKDKYPELFR